MSARDLCIMACVFCRDAQFLAWLTHINGHGFKFSEAGAKAFILGTCKIASRNELDTNLEAAELFHEYIRKPFLEWKELQNAHN